MTAHWKMVYYVFPYKKPFLPGICYNFLPIWECTRSHLFSFSTQSLHTWSPRELLILTTNTGNDAAFCRLGLVQVRYPVVGYIGPGMRTGVSSHLPPCSWAGKAQPSQDHRPAGGWTWPLPAYPITWTPRRVSSRFGEELEVGRQQGKFESLT